MTASLYALKAIFTPCSTCKATIALYQPSILDIRSGGGTVLVQFAVNVQRYLELRSGIGYLDIAESFVNFINPLLGPRLLKLLNKGVADDQRVFYDEQIVARV